MLRCLWVRKKRHGPGDKLGHEGERGPRLEGAAIWTDHLFPWPGLASSYLAISEQRKAETGQHPLRTISLLPTGFECNGMAIFTASQLNPFLRNGSLVESAPVPGGDSSHFLGTDYMPGRVLGALYLISSLPTTSRGRYDDPVSLLSLHKVNSQKPDSNQAWLTCSKLHCPPVWKPGCLYTGSCCLPSAWPGSSYRPPFDLPGILRPHALPMASFTQACPSLVVSVHLPLSSNTLDDGSPPLCRAGNGAQGQ